MVINGQWQGSSEPAKRQDAAGGPQGQPTLPDLGAPHDPRTHILPPPTSALRPRAPSNPARQFHAVYPPRTTSSNARPPRAAPPRPPPPPANPTLRPPPRNASLPHRGGQDATPPHDQNGAAFLPPPRKSSMPGDEEPFGLAGRTPPPHLPLRKQASDNLRLGKSKSEKRLRDPRADAKATEAFPRELRQRPRSKSAETSPSSTPAQSPRIGTFTQPSSSPYLEPPPSAGLNPPSRPYTNRDGLASNTSSVSLASAPAPRPPPSHQNYAVGSSFRSASTPQPLGIMEAGRYEKSSPDMADDASPKKSPGQWRDQPGNSSLRESLHSALTNGSSAVELSGTDRSSIITSRSSSSEVNQSNPNWPKIHEPSEKVEEVIAVDDFLDMYAEGFEPSPAVSATDVDIPDVPPLPTLSPFQKDTLVTSAVGTGSDLVLERGDENPEVQTAEEPEQAANHQSEGTRQPTGPSLEDRALSEQPQPTVLVNHALSPYSVAEAPRRIESLLPEPPPEDPPTPKPSFADMQPVKPSRQSLEHVVAPDLSDHDDHDVLQGLDTLQKKPSEPALDVPNLTFVNGNSLGSGMNVDSGVRSNSPTPSPTKDDPTRSELHASPVPSPVPRSSSSSPLAARTTSTDSSMARTASLQSSAARTASVQSVMNVPQLELSRWDSLQPEPELDRPPRFEPPRASSYNVESPYSENAEATEHAQGPSSTLQPSSQGLLTAGNVNHGGPSLNAIDMRGPSDFRPATAPNSQSPPNGHISHPPVPDLDRPATAPGIEGQDKERPGTSEPDSANTTPMQSPTSAKFPINSPGSSVGSPGLRLAQPERGSFRPAPRARMMAPPTKVGTMGPSRGFPKSFAAGPRTSAQIMAGIFDAPEVPRPSEEELANPHRDRYGFKKASQYVKEEQYDAWNLYYAMYLERRRNKWNELMIASGCSIDKPTEFPPKSDKVKRYIRKGIPPEWRGAAWFYYAGGPARITKDPTLYVELATRGDRGDMSEQDREHIERDLNRTFPDNLKFKADPVPEASEDLHSPKNSLPENVRATMASASTASRNSTGEQAMIRSLRRVLRAFAIHNPKIGYCQSLNFLAGQLLLFLDGDEEKAFHLLCVLTTEHLPGTHGFALEGANVDIGVLMQSLRDTMPAIWSKLDDRAGNTAKTGLGDMRTQTGLPTVSLATTAWFMSCFVGTLPVESACRVWDCLFYEGSKTLFRVALGIFRLGEPEIRRLNDPMEIFQLVQTLPRHLIDANALMEASFGKSLERRGLLGQGMVERRRAERRNVYNAETIANLQPPPPMPDAESESGKPKGLSRGMGTLRRLKSRKGRA